MADVSMAGHALHGVVTAEVGLMGKGRGRFSTLGLVESGVADETARVVDIVATAFQIRDPVWCPEDRNHLRQAVMNSGVNFGHQVLTVRPF